MALVDGTQGGLSSSGRAGGRTQRYILWGLALVLIVAGFAGLDRWFYESFSLWFNTPDPLDRDPYEITKPFWMLVRVGPHATCIIAIYFLILLTKKRGLRLANAFAATIVVVAGFVAIAQVSVARCRPDRADSQMAFYEHHGFSLDMHGVCFPSGEAAVAFATSYILATLYPRWRYLWYGLAVLIACARLLPGAHYPSDVLTSWLLVSIAVVPLFRWFLGQHDRLFGRPEGTPASASSISAGP